MLAVGGVLVALAAGAGVAATQGVFFTGVPGLLGFDDGRDHNPDSLITLRFFGEVAERTGKLETGVYARVKLLEW